MTVQQSVGYGRTSLITDVQRRFSIFLVASLLVGGIAAGVVGISNLEEQPTDFLISLVMVIFSIPAIWFLLHKRYVQLLTNILLLSIIGTAFFGSTAVIFITFSVMGIFSSAILASRPVFALSILAFVVRWVMFAQDGNTTIEEAGLQGTPFIILTLGLFFRYFTYRVQLIIAETNRSTSLIQVTAEIGQATAQILDLDQLFNHSVNLIRDRFDYYHVQVFEVDKKREYARLVASTGEAGRILLQRDHKLAVGSQSVIGRVTQIGGYIIARDTDSDSVHARNELLPNTRSELAIAIVDGEKIVGALDIQSVNSNAFNTVDIQSLQSLANQLAVSIRNARLFEEQTENINENKRLFFESEANLREIQRLNRQLTRRAWEDYLIEKQDVSSVNISKEGVSTEKTWTSSMIEAGKRKRPIYKDDGEKPLIAVPILLRNEVLGAIELEPSTDIRRDDIVELTQAIAGRLAISLDNARLFEEAQESTVQEQRINDIVQRYESAVTVDDLLQITLNELSETLGAEGGAVRLGKLQDKQPSSTVPGPSTSTNGGTPS